MLIQYLEDLHLSLTCLIANWLLPSLTLKNFIKRGKNKLAHVHNQNVIQNIRCGEKFVAFFPLDSI